MFFFFKQKTAYEMRISDWSSDVCSSDLGKLPLESAQFLNSAMVIALKKGETDLRPIAIGGIMRRIVHKIAMRSVARSAARYLSPLPFGVSVPGGCEAIVHSTREYLRLTGDEPACNSEAGRSEKRRGR